jgi:hypothetical protein
MSDTGDPELDAALEYEYYQRQQYPDPCQGCYYADGEMKVCDGTCERLPMSEWEYFKAHPDELPKPT